GRFTAAHIREAFPDGFDLIGWVPVSTLRKMSRGYDQAQLLAKETGKALSLQPTRLLKKIRNTPPQSGILGLSQRKANVLGAYKVIDPALVRDKRILLLDDVVTTGATVSECARMLLTAGAKEVFCVTVACAVHE
ncbi:MAG: ComF family protein, partial [Oscillospiraceae bacterium]|nr:ComF family protein [Oscillospiraceae bacterium]